MLNHLAPQTQSHDIVVMLPGGVPLELVFIPEGDFQMGSPEGEPGRRDYERLHRVRLTRPFFLGKFLVTQEQWMAVMPPATKAESPGFWARLFGAKEPPNPLVYPFCFCATGRMKAYVVPSHWTASRRKSLPQMRKS